MSLWLCVFFFVSSSRRHTSCALVTGVQTCALPILAADACDRSLANLDRLRNANGDTPTAVIRDRMQLTMQADAAVFRTGETLAEGVEKIREICASFADVKVSDRSLVWNSDLVETFQLQNLLGQSLATIVAAENSQESRVGRASGRESVCPYG